jgi:homoserine kinase
LKEILLRAPATVANFGPGFDIFALALEKPCNLFRVRLCDSPSLTITITGEDESIPTAPENNTAGLAAIHFFKKINSSLGAEIEIIKHMKSGSGLGSSAASAVASVYGLNRLCRSALKDKEIIEIASLGEVASGGAPHADNVAGCLLGGFVMIKKYSPLDFAKIEVPDIPLVIGVMRKPQQTTRYLIPENLRLSEIKEQMSSCASLVHALLAGDLQAIGRAVNKDYISEPVRSKFIPGYQDIKDKILSAGAYGCNVSGGGSSVFAICREDKTQEVAGLLKAHFRQEQIEGEVIITRGSNSGVAEVDEL